MTPKIMYMTGIDKVLGNLNRSSAKIGAAVERGLKEGAKYLRERSLDLVPVQIGNLKGSAYAPRNVGGHGFKADIVVGYTSEYALWVHEDLVSQAPPARAAHGKFFNVKHAAEIAAAGKITKKGKWKATSKAGTAQGGMFPRGEKEQAKFLEQPMRDERQNIFKIIANVVRSVK